VAERVNAPVRVPAGMLAVAVLLWGWHQDAMLWAALAAIAVEAARVATFRWDFGDADFHRLGDVTAVGLALLGVVQFGDRGLTGIYGVLRWMPLVILALLLAQLYSTRRSIKLSAIFLSVRLALRRGRITAAGDLDMRLPFLVTCLLSACAGAAREQWAVLASGAVLAWLLWSNRPPQVAKGAVLAALALCVSLVAAGQAGVTATRHALGPIIMDIVRERMAHWRDPFRNYTALGEIGRIKVSDRIALRVEAPPGTPVPALLTEATYTHFSNNVWLAGRADFEALNPGADGTRWDVAGDRRPFRLVTIAKSLIRNKGMLAVPGGAFRIDDLPVEELHASPLGALKVIQGPALVRYSVRYAADGGFRATPQERDLTVPQRLSPLVRRTLEDLGIGPDTSATHVAARLQAFFADHFRYTLDLEGPTLDHHPLEHFLERSRSGHCEYFATATVLLLRAAGVPARYATGYSVQEWSPLEKAWLVRRRHSHAWASAWIGDRWVDIDTTPAVWVAEDAAGAAWWQPAYDLVSYLLHRFARWRLQRIGSREEESVLLWMLVPLTLFLAVRVYRSRRVTRPAGTSAGRGRPASARPGLDSDFYRVEALLARRGLVRPEPVTPRAWLRALDREGLLPPGSQDWEEVIDLHYRARFRPRGLGALERERLGRAVARWEAALAGDSEGSRP
jgi:transglutaminase-like putative cysteine protease